jgi:hypothetical protein
MQNAAFAALLNGTISQEADLPRIIRVNFQCSLRELTTTRIAFDELTPTNPEAIK